MWLVVMIGSVVGAILGGLLLLVGAVGRGIGTIAMTVVGRPAPMRPARMSRADAYSLGTIALLIAALLASMWLLGGR